MSGPTPTSVARGGGQETPAAVGGTVAVRPRSPSVNPGYSSAPGVLETAGPEAEAEEGTNVPGGPGGPRNTPHGTRSRGARPFGAPRADAPSFAGVAPTRGGSLYSEEEAKAAWGFAPAHAPKPPGLRRKGKAPYAGPGKASPHPVPPASSRTHAGLTTADGRRGSTWAPKDPGGSPPAPTAGVGDGREADDEEVPDHAAELGESPPRYRQAPADPEGADLLHSLSRRLKTLEEREASRGAPLPASSRAGAYTDSRHSRGGHRGQGSPSDLDSPPGRDSPPPLVRPAAARARGARPIGQPQWSASPEGAGVAGASSGSSDEEAGYDPREDMSTSAMVARAVRAIRREERAEAAVDPRFTPLLRASGYRLLNRTTGFSVAQRKGHRRARQDLVEMLQSQHKRFDGSEPVGIIRFLRRFQAACNAMQIAEGQAVYMLQWLVTEDVMTIVHRVVPVGDQGNEQGNHPRYKVVVQALLDEYLEEDTLVDAVRELQAAQQKPYESEGTFADRLVETNGKLGSLLNELELRAILLRGVGKEVRAAGRQFNTKGRSFTRLKTFLETTGSAIRDQRQLKLAPKPRLLGKMPKAETRVARPMPKAPAASRALATVDPVLVAAVDERQQQAHDISMSLALEETVLAMNPALPAGWRQPPAFAGRPEPAPGRVPDPKPGHLGTGTPMPPRTGTVYPHSGRSPQSPGWNAATGRSRRAGRCAFCFGNGHWMSECPQLPEEVRLQGALCRDAVVRRRQGDVHLPTPASAAAAAAAAQAGAAAAQAATPPPPGGIPIPPAPPGLIHQVEVNPAAYTTDDESSDEDGAWGAPEEQTEGDETGDDDQAQGNE